MYNIRMVDREDNPIYPLPGQHGRGAGFNPPNRFESLYYEPDPDDEEPPNPTLKTQYFRDTTQSFITYNDSPDVGFKAGINPYRGCEHGCIYCFARPFHEYLGLSAGLDFESKIFVKTDGPQILRRELSAKKWQPQTIALSGVTDPYQPIEKRLGLTRRCLEVLLEFRNPVGIITKNFLIARDIDILSQMKDYYGCHVCVSVTTLQGDLARIMEPRASQPADRLAAIEKLSRAGVSVQVLVAPVIPGLTDQEMPMILRRAAEAGAAQAGYVLLRLPHAVSPLFQEWLSRHFPDRKEKILHRLREMRNGKLYDSAWGTRMRGQGTWAKEIEDCFELYCRKFGFGLNQREVALSAEHFRNPAEEKQYHLF